MNPVNGAVGLLWTGNWNVCQAAVETVLRGGTLRAMPELVNAGGGGGGGGLTAQASDDTSEAEVACTDMWKLQDPNQNSTNCRFSNSRSKVSQKRKRLEEPIKLKLQQPTDLDLCLTPSFVNKISPSKLEIGRPGTPSMNSEESVTTTCFDSGVRDQYGNGGGDRKLLNLFV